MTTPSPTAELRPDPGRASVPHALLGATTAVAAFLSANPAIGPHRVWPFELFRDPRIPAGVGAGVMVLWALALWLLAFSFTGKRWWRSAGGLALGVVVLLLSGSGAGDLILWLSAPECILLVCLGAGFVAAITGSGMPHHRRALFATAGLTLLVVLVTRGDGETLKLPSLLDDLRALFTGGDLTASSAADIWGGLGSAVALAIAIVIALLASCGLRWRPLMWVGVVAVAYVVLAPVGINVADLLSDGGGLEAAGRSVDVGLVVLASLIGHGVLVIAVGVFCVVELMGLHAEAHAGGGGA